MDDGLSCVGITTEPTAKYKCSLYHLLFNYQWFRRPQFLVSNFSRKVTDDDALRN